MDYPVTLVIHQLLKFTLVAFRMLGITVFGPLLGAQAIPAKIRVLVGLGMAWVLFPAVPLATDAVPRDLVGYVIGMGGELAIGAVLGLLISLVIVGVQIGAQMIGQQMGLAMSRIYNPAFDESATLMAQLYYWLFLMVFLCLGGHVALVGALAGSFQSVPLLGLAADRNAFQLLMAMAEQVFIVSAKVAAPTVIALMLTSVAMGFIARTVPQMNILVIGFPVRLALGFLVVSASLMGAAYLFEDFAQMGRTAVERMIVLFAPAG